MRTSATIERWPIARPFTTARGTKTTADVVLATVSDGDFEGRGECVPYPRYGDAVADVAETIGGFRGPYDRIELLDALPAGPARNAIDCALWEIEAKRRGVPAWRLAGVRRPVGIVTAFTVSLASIEAMGDHARAERDRPLLKIKLGSDDVATDIERIRAVRANAPSARLIVDANEGWTLPALEAFAPIAVELGVELIEQPLPEGTDGELVGYDSPVPVCADESIRDGSNLAAVAQRYRAVNIKLDKTGGLTRALTLAQEVNTLGLQIMVGCMVSTSLSMAPALLLAQHARFVDLDGPQLLAADRDPGLEYNGSHLSFTAGVWG